MNFETDKNNPTVGNANLSPDESIVCRNALLARVINMALSSNEPTEKDIHVVKIAKLTLTLTGSKLGNLNFLGSASSFKLLATVVESYIPSADNAHILSAQGLCESLSAASNLLRNNEIHGTQLRTQTEINSIIQNIDIPDSPEGLF